MCSDYSLTHLSDPALLESMSKLVARERATTADLLAHVAEVDARKLFREAAYPSMFAYCVGELHLSEDAAYRHITAARAARRYPALFEAIADGRLHLSAVVLLAAHLTPESAGDLIESAAHLSKVEIERLLAARFPQPDVLASIRVMPPGVAESGPSAWAPELAPERVEAGGSGSTAELAPARAAQEAPEVAGGRVATGSEAPRPSPAWTPSPRHPRDGWARVRPLSSRRFALHVTIGEVTHSKLRYAQELLSHQSISGDVAAVLDRALSALIAQLEKRKFAATSRPRPSAAEARPGARYVPAEVRRAVWRRDGGRCTFVSESGRRCEARELLEFDHVDEVARGGRATVDRMRLRCRAHNQLEAERRFGAEFVSEKREESRRSSAERRDAAAQEGGTCLREPMVVCDASQASSEGG